MRESQEVESRVIDIHNEDDLIAQLEDAGDKLVLLEVQSDVVCETGLDEPEEELGWKLDVEKRQRERLAQCSAVKSKFQRTARECPDCTFLALTVDGSEAMDSLQKRLNVSVLPTLQFYRQSKLLYEHRGVIQMEDGMGEGVMYYSFGSNNTENTTGRVTMVGEVTGAESHAAFLAANSDPKVLTVLKVGLTGAKPCLKIFPTVVALAKAFDGYASFGRLVSDTSDSAKALAVQLGIVQVPTFIFYRAGKEVGRHIGSSKGDLIGQILQQQSSFGISPPPPPVTAAPKARKGLVRKARS